MSSPAVNASSVNEKTDDEEGKLDPSKQMSRSVEVLELGKKEMLTYRRPPWYLRVPFCEMDSPPPPPSGSLDDAPLLPEATASIFSRLTFGWIFHVLYLGYNRPLEAIDLYRLQDSRNAEVVAEKITKSFEQRRKAAELHNERLASGKISPGLRRVWWAIRGSRKERERLWREKGGKKKPSLVLAMNDSILWWFWSGAAMKVVGDTAQMLSTLIVKALINFAKDSFESGRSNAPPIGRGIGLAIGLLALQLFSFLCTQHFFYRSSSTGVLVRGGLITAIYSRSMRLSTRARAALPTGRIVNHISTDVSRIDFCCQFFHMFWTAPIQMGVCLILLLLNLGPSALAGYAFFVLVTPINASVMRRLFRLRQKSMVWTDKRAKLLQEILGGIRIIKFFSWEVPFLKRIGDFRTKEIYYVRALLIMRSAVNAVAFTLPVFAAVISFVVYSLSGHGLDPATIFASLTLFQLLRMPLMFFPMSVSAITDAANASERLYDVFVAELSTDQYSTDNSLDAAIKLEKASFTWDAPLAEREQPQKGGKKGAALKAKLAKPKGDETKTGPIFHLDNIDLEIPRGSLVGIVGPVGSGKSSLLQGLLGDMRRTSGSVTFGGSIAYCPQTAWIQNASVRENICFGRPFDEERYWKAIRDSCLERDLELLPDYDMTEVGEKGISLSGGQKQRLNICRAIYCDSEILIFDDPLSALDAHVGRAVFQRVLLSSEQKKTRVLVTHALHFLPQVDYIYVIVDGKIIENGTYAELVSRGETLTRFMQDYGSKENHEEESESKEEAATEVKKQKSSGPGAAMMQAEERVTGAVSGEVYAAYIKAGRGVVVVPLLLLCLILMQGSSVMSSYWLVYWQNRSFNISQGAYMGIYAALGISQAFWTFFSGAMFASLSYFASKQLHRDAIKRVLHAPMSFFETTPLGRIMNRFAKDIDTVDNFLGDSLRMFSNTFSQIIGAILLISIQIPWFAIASVCLLLVFYYMALFYRTSARELKRLDAILRSSLYAHFSESLSGLATIRAYGETDRFERENKERMDIENRAYWLTVTNQQWLGIRLNCLGTVLTFIVSILTVATRFSISPAQTGVVLSYIVAVQQSFGWMVRQSAEVENNMNSVERVVHYTRSIEQEASHEIKDKRPPPEWPSEGHIEFKNITLKYRPELPPVLKGISMDVKGGEKIGIVGRTGAGKSSIMVALYRLVELVVGSITIDGIDIASLGLADVRSKIAIIPQDPILFSGTLRSNLDPFGLHDDARLWDALRRSYMVEDTVKSSLESKSGLESGVQTPTSKFTLDSPVEDEGSNLSVGQRSLVSLARALVKDSKVLVLDEATASVDYETDRKIQVTIATEFADRTILCIAHRLRTIISYDRICVMDAGQIVEFDTPSNLYQRKDSIFRGMCDQSSISWEDIRLSDKAKYD